MSNIPKDLLYTKEHEWLKVEDDHAYIGITDFAQASLGDIVFVELPEVDSQLDSDASFGVVESIKSVSDLYSPVAGTVVEKNDEVEQAPEKINEGPYSAWLIKVKLDDASAVDELMSAAEYQDYCESEA